MVVKRIGVVSAGKISGILYAGIGLVFGLFFSLFAVVGSAIGSFADEGPGAAGALFGLLFGLGAVVVMPIAYGLLGFLAGLLSAALYNLASRLVGGLEIDLE